MLRVLEAAFGGWPSLPLEGVTPLEHLRWKMAPPGPPRAHSVAVVDGEVAAVSVRWGTRTKVGDQELVLDGGVDQAVDPAMQGRGLGRAIATFSHEAGAETGDMSIGSGGSDPAIPRIFDVFDPVLVEYPLTVWVRTFGPRRFVATHLRGGGVVHLGSALARRGAHLGRALARGLGSGALLPSGVRLEVWQRFDARAEALWERFAAQFDVAVVRDAEYLNWRYCDRGAGATLVLAAIEGDQADGRLLGYAVFKRADDRANMLDLVMEPGSVAVARALLSAGAARMRAAGAQALMGWFPEGHPAEPVLQAAGYVEAGWSSLAGFGPQKRGASGPAVEQLYAGTARIHVTLGDQDFV